jgi:uncharacterized protein YdhG (YjbR/CyaY superfamily)
MMSPTKTVPSTIDAYIAAFPRDVRQILQKIRLTIKTAAPQAKETISYKIPAFALNGGRLVYFAAYQRHVAAYPVPAGDAAFRKKIEIYRAGRGTLRFPLNKRIPYGLISKAVKFLVEERATKARAKARR